MDARHQLTLSGKARQLGAGLIETMVGILIGLVVVLVVYNTLVVAEGYKRSTIGISDAQITGQLAQFVLNRELSNAGNGVRAGTDELARCSEWRLRPIPALIGDGGSATVSDSITVFYSNAPRIVHPVVFGGTAVTPAPYPVISPNGFKGDDWVIATDRGANCTLVLVQPAPNGVTQLSLAAGSYPPADVGGQVALSYTVKAGVAWTHDASSRAINLGQRMTRTQYTVHTAKQQLNSLDDNPGLAVAATPVPVAQNVVLLKAQYGIDSDGDALGLVDCWTSADNSNTCGNGVDYSNTTFTAVPAAANSAELIRSIKAVRIAIVVRSDDDVKQDAANATLLLQTAWLFNCAANNATCQGRMQIDNTVLEDYRRYRIYEATIPLRNSLWHPL